jgi:hypothetical protein
LIGKGIGRKVDEGIIFHFLPFELVFGRIVPTAFGILWAIPILE